MIRHVYEKSHDTYGDLRLILEEKDLINNPIYRQLYAGRRFYTKGVCKGRCFAFKHTKLFGSKSREGYKYCTTCEYYINKKENEDIFCNCCKHQYRIRLRNHGTVAATAMM